MIVEEVLQLKRPTVVLSGASPLLEVGWCVRSKSGGVWEILGIYLSPRNGIPPRSSNPIVVLRQLTGPSIREGDSLEVDLGAMVIRKWAHKLRNFLVKLTPEMRSRFLNSVLRDFCQYCGNEIEGTCTCTKGE